MLLDGKTSEELIKIKEGTLELIFLANRANEIAHSDLAHSYNIKVNLETIRILGDKERLVSYIDKHYDLSITNGEAIKHYIDDLQFAQDALIEWIVNGGDND